MSYTFKDKTGREWDLAITLGGARRVLNAVEVDLLNPASETGKGVLSMRLMSDDVLLYNVVVAIISPQLDKANVKEEAFAEEIDGEVMRGLESAFWNSYRNFFKARGKDWAAKAIEADLKARSEATAKAEKNIEALTGEPSFEQLEEPEPPQFGNA